MSSFHETMAVGGVAVHRPHEYLRSQQLHPHHHAQQAMMTAGSGGGMMMPDGGGGVMSGIGVHVTQRLEFLHHAAADGGSRSGYSQIAEPKRVAQIPETTTAARVVDV